MKKPRFIGLSAAYPQLIRKKLSSRCIRPWTMQSEKTNCVIICSKQRSKLTKNWQNKKNEKIDQRKNGFKPSPFRKGTRSHTDNNYSKQGPNASNGVKDTSTSNGGWNNTAKEVKCWGYNGPDHIYRNCPHNPNRKMAPINMQ